MTQLPVMILHLTLSKCFMSFWTENLLRSAGHNTNRIGCRRVDFHPETHRVSSQHCGFISGPGCCIARWSTPNAFRVLPPSTGQEWQIACWPCGLKDSCGFWYKRLSSHLYIGLRLRVSRSYTNGQPWAVQKIVDSSPSLSEKVQRSYTQTRVDTWGDVHSVTNTNLWCPFVSLWLFCVFAFPTRTDFPLNISWRISSPSHFCIQRKNCGSGFVPDLFPCACHATASTRELVSAIGFEKRSSSNGAVATVHRDPINKKCKIMATL